MNLLWGGMLLIGILYGAFNGRMQEITDAVLSASREAVTLCVTMTGILAFWQGLMEIAKDAGLTEQLCGKIRPLIRFLFPEIPADHPAYESISMNFIANFLGLGMAATPAGLKAMKDVHLPDYEYFLPPADPCHHDRLPQPVRQREPRRHHIPGHSGYGSEYRGGGDFLQGDGEMRKQRKSPLISAVTTQFFRDYHFSPGNFNDRRIYFIYVLYQLLC